MRDIASTLTGSAYRIVLLVGTAKRRWRDNDFNKPGRHVIDKTGNQPLARQCRNRPEQCNVDGDCCVRIGDRFLLKFRFVYLKIVRQHGGVARKASDAAIGVLKNYHVELPAPSRTLPSNLTDSPEETQLFQQPRRDSTTYITDHDGLSRFDSKYMSRVHTHISAPDDYCLHIGHRLKKRGH